MASLYRKPVVVVDPRTREKTKTKSKKWWGQFKDSDGRLRRHPLAVDKLAAQAMLNEMVRRMEREKAGLIDPTDTQRKRPITLHIQEFEAYLENKGVTAKQVKATISQLNKVVTNCKWRLIGDVTAGALLDYLGRLRRGGRSAQTSNHYLKSAKQFTRWSVRDRRSPTDPLAHLARLNVATDRRHDRRALSQDEFQRLVDAARVGKKIEGISGPDRAMLYILAAWTGFRKAELGSLTQLSLDLDGQPATATVEACYSKHRRRDTQILHPEVVRLLKEWLKKKALKPGQLLFPVSGRVPGGIERKAFKMIQRDLASARTKWIEEAKQSAEQLRRQESDFLAHKNHAGLFADFHSLRHYFITSLERSGISPKMAQSLARHSDIRLTLGVYTHVTLHDQTSAIQSLPGPLAKVAVRSEANARSA